MFISFGEPSLLLLFPFCMPIFSFLRTYLEMIVPFFTEPDKDTNPVKVSFPFFTSFLIMLSNLVMGIPVAIAYCINRHKKRKQVFDFTDVRLTKSVMSLVIIKKEINYQVYLLIILVALLVSTVLISSVILNSIPSFILIGFKMNIFLIFFDSIFSYFILKYSIHKHQLVAIGICIIGIIIVCLNVLIEFDPISFFGFIGVNLLVSMVDIIEKWLMEKKFINPSNLLFYIGICGVIIFIFISIAVSHIECPPDTLVLCKQERFTNHSIENIIEILNKVLETPYVLGMMVVTVCVGTVYLLFFFLTLFYFTPTHRCVSDILNSFIFWIYTNVADKTDEYFGLTLAGYLVIVFGSLVYNEIIILHFWGLDYNTKKGINQRSIYDSQVVLLARNDNDHIERNHYGNDDGDDDTLNGISLIEIHDQIDDL